MKTDWRDALADFIVTPAFAELRAFVKQVYARETVLPAEDVIYAALQLCSLAETRVVILGQDPYPTPGHAHGLAFSVQRPIAPPPSLRNMLKEIEDDLGPAHIQDGDLTPWAKQGVLLLNTILTVKAGAPLSHAGRGWEAFTDEIIKTVAREKEHVVFMLWGSKAKAKAKFIDPTKHLILTAAHPSPLSAWNGFFGCRHFSAANNYLIAHNRTPIVW
jgi:uracil-DNA glycosylase